MRVFLWLIPCLLLGPFASGQEEDFVGAHQTCKIDLVFIVDASGSVCDNDPTKDLLDDAPCENWKTIRTFMKNITKEFQISSTEVLVSVITFGSSAAVRWTLTDHPSRSGLEEAIDNLHYSGGMTNAQLALEKANTEVFTKMAGDRESAGNVVIFISDGMSNVNELNTISAADQLKLQSHAQIFSVGVTNEVDEVELRDISSAPKLKDRNYFLTPSFNELQTIKDALTKASCEAHEGGEGACTRLDVCFVIDGSGSICKHRDTMTTPQGKKTCDNWELVKSFTQRIASTFDIGDNNVLVAMVVFGNRGKEQWNFNQYNNKDDLLGAISELDYLDANTNTSGGLAVARESIFNIRGGDRPGVHNVAIVITDGRSTYDNDTTILNAERLRNEKDVKTFVVGVTDEVNTAELSGISSLPQVVGKNYFLAPEFDKMATVLEPLITEACDDKRVVHENCSQNVDMIYVIDSSASIRANEGIDSSYDNWDSIMGFIAYGMKRWPGGAAGARVGIITFSDVARVQIPFGAHNNSNDLTKAIFQIPYDGHETKNTAAGLRAAIEMLRSPGNRAKIPDVVIIITDQPPNEGEDELDEVLAGIHVERIVLGVTLAADEAYLKSLASDPKKLHENYWLSGGFTDIKSMVSSIEQSLATYLCGGGQQIPDPPPSPVCNELDITFIVDASGSIRNANPDDGSYDNWNVTLKNLEKLVYVLDEKLDQTVSNVEHRIALVKFSTQAQVVWPLDKFVGDKSGLIQAIRSLKYSGHLTNTPQAIEYTRERVFVPENGDRPSARNVAIMFSDGEPENPIHVHPREDTVREAELLRNTRGVHFLAVGITPRVVTNPLSTELLSRISSPPHRRDVTFWKTFDFRSVSLIVNQMAGQACDPDPDVCKSDVVFVLDYSGSIGTNMFNNIREFVSAIIGGLDVGISTNIGAVSFSDNAARAFHLNEFSDRSKAAKAIEEISYVGGRTHTADALKYARTDMFREENGDRPDVQNVVVVLTDGGSNVPDKELVLAEALKLKQIGAHIIALGIGKWVDEYEMNAIASYPYTKNSILLPNHNELPTDRESIQQLIDLLCNNNNECEPDPCDNGGSCEDRIGGYICKCTEGFIGKHCDRTCRQKADVVFALDGSGSVGRDNFQKEVDFVSDVVLHGLNVNEENHRVGALDYSTDVRIKFNLDDYLTQAGVLNGLSFIYRKGSTNTAGAINTINDDVFTSGNGDRSNVDNVGIVITDGRSNDPVVTWEAAKAFRADQQGNHLIAVGVGTNIRRWELEGIASYPYSNNVLRIDSFDEFGDFVEGLTDAICNNDDECSTDPCENGGMCVDLRGGYRCDCPDGYTGRNCERECSGELDLIIILDSSGSVRSRRFLKVKDFLQDVINELEISGNKTRVGLVYYSDDATVAFTLNRYTDKTDVFNHLQRVPYLGDRTNTAAALRTMTDSMFTSGNGDRSNVENMAIIVTNANSNIDHENTLPEAIRAMTKGIHIVAVGIGDDTDYLELRGLASYPQSATVFHARSQDDLPGYVANLVQSTCKVDGCSNGPCSSESQCVSLYRDYYCECRPRDVGKNCDSECSDQMDIVFILDISGSVNMVYHVVTNFTRRMIHGLPVQQQRAQVGIITFATEASIQFNLNTYQGKREMLTALAFAQAGGSTNTQQALNVMRTQMFTSNNGDRSGVNNKVVVLTDGRSNIEPGNTAIEARKARDDSVEMFVVAIGDNFDRREINYIASNPDSSHVFELRDVNQVNDVADKVLEELC